MPPDSKAKMAQYLLAAVGNTPLVELDFLDEIPEGVRLFAKLESSNPGGSIKDRSVARILTRALNEGHLSGGRRVLDSTTGNAGIAYAMFGAVLGLDVTLVLPGNVNRERLDRIAAHGAEVILTDPVEGQDFAVREAARIARENPQRYWYSDQYSNENNWRAHYETTAQEILSLLLVRAGGPPAALVAGVGTGGTITGVGRYLREANPDLYVAAAIPDPYSEIEGLKPLADPTDWVPPILDESLIDRRILVSSDEAQEACQRLATAGLFMGPSSGAYVHAALQVAQTGRFPVIVTLLSDSGERYGSTQMWRREGVGLERVD